MKETHGEGPDFHLLSVLHRNAEKVPIDNMLEEGNGCGGGNHFEPGIQVQKTLHAARMVRLRVAYHQIVDFLHICDLFQLF